MKYNYCPKCDKAYVKSRLEKDICIYCGSGCETVDVSRNAIYYLGYGIMLAGAACAFVPRFADVSGTTFYFTIGIALAVAGSVFVVMGNARMAEDAKQAAHKGTEDD
ncbi:MAG: hypothetical protein R6W91_02110 [Thermoplasmata archaeon]